MIQWQPPPTESHNGQLMGYMVRYKLAGYAEHTQWYQHNVTNAAQLSYLLDDLIVWQNYQIQIAAYNEMGVGAYSQSIFVRTKEGRPASQVRQLSAEAINSTAIEVHWQSPDPQLINGINQGYKLQAWKSINQSLSPYNELFKEVIVPPAPFPERSQSAIMDGLEPYTTYYITVLCFTSAGDGPKTDAPKIVTTQQDLPEEVSQFKFTDILDKSVRVLWSAPKRVNGKLLGYTLKYYVVGSNEGQKQIVNFTAQQNETIISNLRPQTAYTFEINAWTQVGAGPVESSTIQSSVPPVLPQPPTHLAISNIGAFSVVLQFTPGFNGNASISKWIVEGQLFKLRNANWSVIYESTNHTQNDAIVVHNLRPYTEYRLRLSPVNVVGKSLSPSETSPPFQTLQALPAGPPMNVTLRTVSPTALRVRWTPLPPESWYGHPRGYNVTWSEVDDEGLQSTINSFISDDYHSHSFLITSLEEFTRYGVQVYALNDLGSSPASRLIVQRTNEATPSSGPDSVVVKATSSTTIVVDWGEITKVDRNGILQGFKVKYTSLKSSDSTQYKIIESNQTRTTTLTELKKYTTYRISVCGFTHAGDGVYSTSLTEQTFQDVPGPPSNVTFPDVTHTTARIQWDIPLEPNGEILAYRISYKMSDEDFKRAISREFASTDRTHRFLDLRPETYYIFEVTAKTSEGWGKAAKLIVYTTNSRELPSHPSQPLISTSQISSRQVTISWTPGRDGFAPLRYYTVQISSQGGHWWTYPHKIDPTLRIYTITNLKPFTTYQFRIKATNDIGDSGWSLESPITRTLPAPPDKAPLSVIVSPFTPTSVAVKWTEIQDWNGDEIGAGYRIQYCIISPQGVSSSCPSSIVRGKNITTVSVENLERDQHYEIRVIAFNGQGDGPSSKAKVVYVGEGLFK
jgi:protein sidekick